jgi:hypothetical protein
MHGRVLLVLFECSFAAKMAIAEDTKVVHIVYDGSILFVKILGLITSYNSKM